MTTSDYVQGDRMSNMTRDEAAKRYVDGMAEHMFDVRPSPFPGWVVA